MNREAQTLEAAVDTAIAECGGDARSALRALLVAHTQVLADFDALKADIARLTAAVSSGYARGRIRGGGAGAAR